MVQKPLQKIPELKYVLIRPEVQSLDCSLAFMAGFS
jgi:hypothetical protein